jgi:asparagine synthase (glutamine-hydrolysing)
MSGEGGDELFGGYYTYVADLLARRVGRLAPLARPLAEALPSRHDRVGIDYKAKRFARAAALPPLERHHGWKEIFSAQTRADLAGATASGWDPLDLYRERYAETAGADPLARMQDVDLGIYLVDDLLVKTDRLSMAHSLELRVPFLDAKVAEFAFSLPRRMKVRGFAKKRLLRKSLAPLLPEEIVHGRKQGFSIPLAAWLRGPLEPFAREVLAPGALERQGLLNSAAVTPIVDRHCAGREDLSRQIWGLMALTLWFDRYAH